MNRRIVVFSGGSAANSLVDVFGKVAQDKACSLSYIIPISDNGGSSSELIPLKTFFNHRLDPSPEEARHEWLAIVEGHSPLWSEITSPKRELIRSFLNTINLEIVKRARPNSVFNFQSASVGNLFLTGARIYTGSFEAAIYLLGSITGTTRRYYHCRTEQYFPPHSSNLCPDSTRQSSHMEQTTISRPPCTRPHRRRQFPGSLPHPPKAKHRFPEIPYGRNYPVPSSESGTSTLTVKKSDPRPIPKY
ncbi:hypothetical protein DID88_007169 [Monilinia fructigena]|uniref:Uncharacterized protein n=1 Tax=Monilinia fructigena TaxID=38457 RepID=A0A395J7K8_9HELO|nr:hypothetical protein DID88_007169 [Monilinia fructigena]